MRTNTIIGYKMDDALLVLMQVAEAGLSGTLKSSYGFIRLRHGRIVKYAGNVMLPMILGWGGCWKWKKVEGEPQGDLDLDLFMTLLSTAQ